MRHIAKISVIVLVVIAAGLLLHSVWTEIVLAQSSFSGPGAGCGPGGCGGAVGASSTSRIYVAATSSAYYSIGASGTIYIVSGGLKFPDGTTQTTASGGLSVAAGYVTPGQFNSVQGGGGNYTFPGSLGVGTSSTPFALTLVGSRGALYSNAGGWYQYNAVGTFRSAFFDDNSTTHIYGDGNGTTPAISIEGGNVGIGGPAVSSAKFSVTGAGGALSGTGVYASTFVQDQTNYRGIYLGYDTSGQIGLVTAGTPGPAASQLAFWTYNGSAWGERVRIDGSGNVGIATTTPAYKLTIWGGTYNNSVGVVSTDAVGPGITLQNTGASGRKFDIISTGASATPGAGYFAVYDETAGGAPGYRFVINPSGNVGIATTTPTYPLTVAGVINSSTGGFRFPDGTVQTTAIAAGSSGWTDSGANVALTTVTDNLLIGGPVYANPNKYISQYSVDNLNTGTNYRFNNGTLLGYVYGDTSGFGLLNGGGGWMIRGGGSQGVTNTTVEFWTNNAVKQTIDTNGNLATANYGLSPIGLYDPTRTQQVWAMGTCYRLPAAGATVAGTYGTSDCGANFYGIGWSYEPGYGGAGNNPQSKAGLSHQALFMINGITQTAVGAGVWTLGAMTGQILYDYNNTAYYVDPASTSVLNIVSAATNFLSPYYHVTAGNGYGICFWTDCTNYKIHMGTAAEYWYGPVTEYAIKFNMGAGTTGRGWVWGTTGLAPVAALNVSGNFQIAGTFNSGGTVTVGGGTGKINAGTIDPLYTIGGKRYATYVPGMIGQKEETTGTLNCRSRNGACTATIDFSSAVEGSDIWLFGKTTNIAKQFDKLTVLLTPAFDGTVWYERNSANRTLTIHVRMANGKGQSEMLEISYRLTAPRFDAHNWKNTAFEKEEGFNLDKLIQ